MENTHILFYYSDHYKTIDIVLFRTKEDAMKWAYALSTHKTHHFIVPFTLDVLENFRLCEDKVYFSRRGYGQQPLWSFNDGFSYVYKNIDVVNCVMRKTE